MINIARFSPFEDNVDDLLRGFFVRPMTFEGSQTPAQIRIDVKEDDKGYTVHADIPGVSKEDIHVDIDGSQVSISAEVKPRLEQKESARVLTAK